MVVDAGYLAAHAIWLPPGAEIDVAATVEGAASSVFLYGPRDPHGGVPTCLSRGFGEDGPANAGILNTTGGEYIVLAGPSPGAPSGEVIVTVSCTGLPADDGTLGCEDDTPPCPTLAERGCPDVRCDGELARDDDGCLTCDCEPGRVCGPERGDGPWGTCALPACDCTLAQLVEVCGADGTTWPSACAARCAGVAVIEAGPCTSTCPNLASCETPCWGLRSIDPNSGCPTCDCAPTWPATVADCRACPLDEAPVCGADGVTYRNRCAARCAGAKLLYAAACVDDCRTLPEGCDLDCPWGLRLGDDCVLCDCADGPSATCESAGDTACVIFEGLDAPTT
ncbi:MAG: Kazal-type serine protease inhibitor family protein, partial [Myxococcota bacterium]|nr:Kazal-type serine protease inhibitor family protein [Myxococcota bacterium]